MQMNFAVSAPNLKGRPRRKRKKRSLSPGGSESNESEESSLSTVSSTIKVTLIVPPVFHFSGQECDATLQIMVSDVLFNNFYHTVLHSDGKILFLHLLILLWWISYSSAVLTLIVPVFHFSGQECDATLQIMVSDVLFNNFYHTVLHSDGKSFVLARVDFALMNFS